MAAVNFSGKFVEDTSDNKEAFLKKLGVPADKIAMAMAVKMGCEMIHDGDNFTMKMLAPNDTELCVNKFSIGKPFIPKVPAGEHAFGEMVCTWTEGGKVLHTEATGDDMDFVDDTYIEANGDMKVVQKSGDVTNTTIYKKC